MLRQRNRRMHRLGLEIDKGLTTATTLLELCTIDNIQERYDNKKYYCILITIRKMFTIQVLGLVRGSDDVCATEHGEF